MNEAKWKIGSNKAIPMICVTIVCGLAVVSAGFNELQKGGRGGLIGIA
jgi:hypothetical protein